MTVLFRPAGKVKNTPIPVQFRKFEGSVQCFTFYVLRVMYYLLTTRYVLSPESYCISLKFFLRFFFLVRVRRIYLNNELSELLQATSICAAIHMR